MLVAEIQKITKEPPGEGWKTFTEIMAESQMAEGRARSALKAARASRKVEVFQGSQMGTDGTAYRQVWYRQIS